MLSTSVSSKTDNLRMSFAITDIAHLFFIKSALRTSGRTVKGEARCQSKINISVRLYTQ